MKSCWSLEFAEDKDKILSTTSVGKVLSNVPYSAERWLRTRVLRHLTGVGMYVISTTSRLLAHQCAECSVNAWPAAYNLLISGLTLLGHGCPAVPCWDAAWVHTLLQQHGQVLLRGAPHELHIVPLWCLIRSSVSAAIADSQIPDAVAFRS